MLDRRTLLWGAIAMPAIGLARPAAAASWGQDFAVSRAGSPIGQHRLRFTQDGARTTAEITIELQVKIAFITVYRYRHVNREIWDGEDLLSFASRTDDNGTAHRVQARRSGDRILVESDQGIVEAPGDALPTTYWHRRFLERPQWIDTQNGRVLSCSVSSRGVERIAALDRELAADRFAVAGDLQLDLWYVGEQWVKLAFPGPDGTPIDYRLQRSDRPPTATAS
jgi:Family of unknown function (DUF6134)